MSRHQVLRRSRSSFPCTTKNTISNQAFAASTHYLTSTFPLSFRITIADNASTDNTWAIAGALEAALPNVHATYLSKKGRGRALHAVWMASTAEVVCYMDVDLSTDLSALLPLVAPLLSGHSDVAIGTRLARSSRVVRGPKREVISRCYNVLLRTTLATQFSDAQCGFKAMRADRARELLPMVQDNGWFFDTELLVLAERSGMRIHEVPVDWIDDPDSRVDIVQTAMADLRGIARLTRDLARGRIPLRAHRGESAGAPLGAQLFRFCGVGIASTIAYVALFLVMRTAMSAAWANADRAAHNRDRQYRGQPILHLRRARPHSQVAPSAARTRCLRHRPRPEYRRTGSSARSRATRGPISRSRHARHRQSRRHVLRFLLFRSWVFRRPSPATNLSRNATSTVKELS